MVSPDHDKLLKQLSADLSFRSAISQITLLQIKKADALTELKNADLLGLSDQVEELKAKYFALRDRIDMMVENGQQAQAQAPTPGASSSSSALSASSFQSTTSSPFKPVNQPPKPPPDSTLTALSDITVDTAGRITSCDKDDEEEDVEEVPPPQKKIRQTQKKKEIPKATVATLDLSPEKLPQVKFENSDEFKTAFRSDMRGTESWDPIIEKVLENGMSDDDVVYCLNFKVKQLIANNSFKDKRNALQKSIFKLVPRIKPSTICNEMWGEDDWNSIESFLGEMERLEKTKTVAV